MMVMLMIMIIFTIAFLLLFASLVLSSDTIKTASSVSRTGNGSGKPFCYFAFIPCVNVNVNAMRITLRWILTGRSIHTPFLSLGWT